MRRLLLVVAAGALWLTCKASPIVLGGKCDDSEQCAAGLLCDTTQTPHICTNNLAHVPDVAGTDQSGLFDLAQPDFGFSLDMSASAVDMSKAVDMTKPVDL